MRESICVLANWMKVELSRAMEPPIRSMTHVPMRGRMRVTKGRKLSCESWLALLVFLRRAFSPGGSKLSYDINEFGGSHYHARYITVLVSLHTLESLSESQVAHNVETQVVRPIGH